MYCVCRISTCLVAWLFSLIYGVCGISPCLVARLIEGLHDMFVDVRRNLSTYHDVLLGLGHWHSPDAFADIVLCRHHRLNRCTAAPHERRRQAADGRHQSFVLFACRATHRNLHPYQRRRRHLIRRMSEEATSASKVGAPHLHGLGHQPMRAVEPDGDVDGAIWLKPPWITHSDLSQNGHGFPRLPFRLPFRLSLCLHHSLSLSLQASWIELFVCSLVCPRADCAHFVVLIVRSSPAWHTNARRARRRARRRLHRTSFVVTALDLSALRRLRDHHGSQPPRMAWTCVCCHTENAAYRRKCGNSECRFPGGPPEAWEEKHGKDKRRDKSYPPKHTWHCGECGVDNSSRRWSCSSCGAKPPGSGVSSAAAQPKRRPVSQRQNFAEAVAQERRRVKAVLPVESRSQPDSELTDVKLDEDLNQDRDKCNSKEVANKLKDLDILIRQLQPCAMDDRSFVFCTLLQHISLPELTNGGKAQIPYSAGFSSQLGTELL